jgi:hypothetical protein
VQQVLVGHERGHRQGSPAKGFGVPSHLRGLELMASVLAVGEPGGHPNPAISEVS